MDPERRRKVEQLYQLALEQEPARQGRFLTDACQDDADLRREVESLLARGGRTESLVDETAWAEADDLEATGAVLTPGAKLGPYQILGPLGEGGMGKVYRGLDTRLGRAVAIKVSTGRFSARFEREARAISALNHPHICTLYDVGPDYLVMELVEGETLRDWLKRSPAVERSLEIARQVLEALRAAHGAGIVHRDLKPQNIMVRFDGYVKVLDFGLAKRIAPLGALQTERPATIDPSIPGQILGTVAYMPPEQIQGQEIDQRSDLFAFGIILYEMLTGKHPWPRTSSLDTLHAILHDEAPPTESTFAGVIQKLLCKDREERYPSAQAVLEALATPALARAPSRRSFTRLIVLPFRILRRREASDFLSVSLPDAISSSLAAIDSLVVRSTMAASRFAASPELDVNAIAEQAQVDAILTGSILSDGENLRVTTQLVEAPSGTVLWSNTSQVSLRDIFQLQDELVDRIVQSLTVPLTAGERRALKHDVPASAIGYEFYLRANQLATTSYDPQNMLLARDLYLRSVEADPKYAPAWAGLGRTYRLIGKYTALPSQPCVDLGSRGVEDLVENLACADDAFRKAFALNPDLALAHNFYTSLQTDLGRSLEAMERLLKRAHTHRNDPNLLAGLVHACRYCGLLEASVAAHDLARRLDPHIRTTVVYAYLDLGEFQRVIDNCDPRDGALAIQSLISLGRKQEAIAYLLELKKTSLEQLNLFGDAIRASLEGDRNRSLELIDRVLELPGPLVHDPESHYWIARELATLDEPQRALNGLSLALDSGYRCHYALLHDPRLESVRSHSQFTELVNRAAALDLEARAVFLDNGGDRLLGVKVDRKPREPVRATPKPLTSIAVLAFANMSADKENEYFSDGLAEEVINRLAHVPGMKVAGHTSSFFFRGKDVEFAEIGRRLNVEHILEGSVRRAGNRVRVTAQLIKVTDGFHLWSERYDREMTDIFAIQDEITQAITEALRIKLSPEAAPLRRHEPNLRAYEAYLKAREQWFKGTAESQARFKQSVDRAIELDSEFALPYTLLGGQYSMLAHLGIRPAREVIPLAQAAEEEALRLDPSLPEAHAMLGVWAGTYNYDWNEAERRWRLAMAREPAWLSAVKASDIRFWYGNHYLLPIGRPVEAVEALACGVEGDPLNLLYRNGLARGLRHAGRLEDAEAELRKVLEIDENFPLALDTLGAICAQQGRFEEALALTERACVLMPWANAIKGRLAALLVHTGARSRADTLIEKLMPGKAYGASTGLALFHAMRGDFDQAAAWAAQAIEERYPEFVKILGPLLRPTPKWPALAKLMNLPG